MINMEEAKLNDEKVYDRMTKQNKEKIIKLRKENKKESIELSNEKMYCMNCHEIFKAHKENWDDRGCVDRDETLHCCEFCGKCHDLEDGYCCGHCGECHYGTENDLDLAYARCPKCKLCFEISLYKTNNLECNCGFIFNYSDSYNNK